MSLNNNHSDLRFFSKNKALFILHLLLLNNIYSQQINESIIKTEVGEVTVFIEGAQITRTKTVDLNSGITLLKFTDLSPFIKSKSVQVKASGDVTVLGVNHQQNFIDKMQKSEEVSSLENKLETLQNKIQIENTHIGIINEEIKFLSENRQIGGKNETLTVNDLKTTSDFYSTKLTALKLEELHRQKTLGKLFKEQQDITDQLNAISSKKDFSNVEVVVKIESKKNQKSTIELNYVVNNAGWFPSYDLRAKSISEPIKLVYKANVKQDTKVDWKNVKLKFSSANPNLSGTAPELQTYFLDYNSAPPRYNKQINEVSGVVTDNNNNVLPGVSVIVEGTTIGTSSNFDGVYSLAIPNTTSQLTFTHLGYKSKTLPVYNSTLNVQLTEDMTSLDEVVVVGYGRQKKNKSIGSVLETKASGIQIDKSENQAIPLQKIENQTTVDFEIDIPYTINSDNKSYAVEMIKYNLPANYQYYAIPKVEKEAYLIANINNWEEYSLLEGEANIFFENTFVGKTILDTRFTSDTLQVSLGRDKNVNVNREKVTDFTSKKFVGTKKEQSRVWKISVKNNKSKSINMIVLDQVPVSRLEEIKVDILELSKGKLNTDTGEIKWAFELSPNDKKEFILNYNVKFPKNKNLVIE